MTDYDFEETARCVARYETLRKVVRSRQYTGKPGDGWKLSSVAELPEYYSGLRNKIMITSAEDGNSFEVLVLTFGGQLLHSKTYKTVDAAFRNGEKFADIEYHTLRRIRPDERTDEQRDRLRAVAVELAELLSISPAGYSVPKAAADLTSYAQAHGWSTEALWTSLGYDGEPFLKVRVGRQLTGEERDEHRGDRWVYELTWHSRDCAPGKVRRFGQGTAVTPDDPATHGCPSLKAIREVIAAHPADVAKAA